MLAVGEGCKITSLVYLAAPLFTFLYQGFFIEAPSLTHFTPSSMSFIPNSSNSPLNLSILLVGARPDA